MTATVQEILLYPWRHWVSGGALLVPIACVCFGTWAYYLQMRRVLRGVLEESRALERRIADTLPSLDLGALVAGNESGSVFLPVLARVVAAVRNGLRPAAAFDREERVEMDRLRRNLVILAALTAVAPLLGLLGTVMGMVETFEAVSVSGGETASRVASGISKALITTQFGLTVAIPGVFGLARLQRLLCGVQTQFAIIRGGTLPALRTLAHAGGSR